MNIPTLGHFDFTPHFRRKKMIPQQKTLSGFGRATTTTTTTSGETTGSLMYECRTSCKLNATFTKLRVASNAQPFRNHM